MDRKTPRQSDRKNIPARSGRAAILILGILALVGIGIFADWWTSVPEEEAAEVMANSTFVGRSACMDCHAGHYELWKGSHHDLAMDYATDDSVLGDFDNATIAHFGITSKMFTRDGKYFVNTEGPDGEMADFHVKYVFGVTPLQQYMVEFDRTADMTDNEVSRVQVLRLSWNTEEKQWFYLSPPDVDEKLDSNDPLHWTGSAQNWNHMCAECHSTNLKKNYDLAQRRYRTSFSEMDVSCEACHGPGSTHVELANAKSLFWDRNLGFGLAKLKGENSRAEIHTCAKCHSRRSLLQEEYHGGGNFYDNYVNELLSPETYYCDGQVKDEVYVFGSFIQSKMYAKGIRCTDCHDPHTAELKFTDNRLCTSCHQHHPAKYDTPAHHHHNTDSTGASCIDCHMPHAPFMNVDLRRDHSLRIPRPDLSVELQTPNACTGCHLESKNVSEEKRPRLNHYADWLKAREAGDEEITSELKRVDAWCAEKYREWYGDSPKNKDDHIEYAHTIKSAWNSSPTSLVELAELAANRRAPAMIRASALTRLESIAPNGGMEARLKGLTDRDPLVRGTAARSLAVLRPAHRIEYLVPLLKDEIRFVRIEAAIALADLAPEAFTDSQQRALGEAIRDYRNSLLVNADQISAHMALGILAERLQSAEGAIRAYQTAISLDPDVTGPRSNLAALMDRLKRPAEANKYRTEELQLLARDSELAPDSASVQYRYGLALHLAGRSGEALPAIQRAVELEPNVPDFTLALALLYKEEGKFVAARDLMEKVIQLRPENQGFRQLYQQLEAAANQSQESR